VAVSPDHVDPTDEEAVAVAGVAAQALEMLLSSHFDCARGVPEDVEMHYYTTTPPGVLPGEPAPEGDE
jgi:hypothetical protein